MGSPSNKTWLLSTLLLFQAIFIACLMAMSIMSIQEERAYAAINLSDYVEFIREAVFCSIGLASLWGIYHKKGMSRALYAIFASGALFMGVESIALLMAAHDLRIGTVGIWTCAASVIYTTVVLSYSWLGQPFTRCQLCVAMTTGLLFAVVPWLESLQFGYGTP